MKRIKSTILGTGVGIALALAAWMPAQIKAAENMKPMKGGEHLLMLNHVETKAEVEALNPDDTLVMVCAKCKTVYISRVKQGVKGAQVLFEKGEPKEVIGSHACKGCKSTLEIVGVQKGAHTELKHTCGSCGSDSAFCCASKAAAAKKVREEEKK